MLMLFYEGGIIVADGAAAVASAIGDAYLTGQTTAIVVDVTNDAAETHHQAEHPNSRHTHCDAAQSAGNARHGSGGTLRGSNQGSGAGGQAQPGALPGRFHVSVGESRPCRLESTNCDLKSHAWCRRTAPYAFTEQGLFRAQQSACHRGEHQCYLAVRLPTSAAGREHSRSMIFLSAPSTNCFSLDDKGLSMASMRAPSEDCLGTSSASKSATVQ